MRHGDIEERERQIGLLCGSRVTAKMSCRAVDYRTYAKRLQPYVNKLLHHHDVPPDVQ